MEITFAPRGILQVDDARICWRNFKGEPTKFNPRGGDRTFSLIIPENVYVGDSVLAGQDIANRLIEDGWNVKIREPREEGEAPFIHLPVKVSFNERGPQIFVIVGDNPPRRLDEDMVGMLDDIVISSVDMDIAPYNYDVSGRQGVAAYVRSMYVHQELDRLAAKYGGDRFAE